MKDKKVVFMGTPEYSVPTLKMLIENTNVIAVVTQPDKEVGRKKILTPSPVKALALEKNIKVLTPNNLKENYQEIIDLNPDIIITCAYGQIIPEKLIYFPKYDTVNVHASLLPKYRGGAPINRAIINGEKETGITIMYTDKGLDSGDIITSRKLSININDNYDVVSDKLSIMGAELLKEELPKIFKNDVIRTKQNDEEVTYAKIITREDEKLDFSKTALEVHNKIRGLSSFPGAYSLLNGASIKILSSELNDCKEIEAKPGTITRTSKDAIFVACKDKEIRITKIQVAGKKPLLVKDYLNGLKNNNLINQKFDK